MKNRPAIKIMVIACALCGSLYGGPTASLGKTSCSSSIVQVVDPARKISDRIRAANLLSAHLSSEDIHACFGFLLQPVSGKDKNIAGLRALKNDLLNSLEGQEIAPAGLVDVMVRMYKNKAEDPAIRDYAIQHLAAWMQKSPTISPADKAKAVETLTEILEEGTSIAGTALLGLHRISELDSSIQAAVIDRAALALAISSGTDLRARITAVQVCAERNLTRALPTICDLAAHAPEIPLRVSAIGALSRIGSAEYGNQLRELQLDANPLVRTAALSALKKEHHFVISQEVVESAQ